VLARKYKAAGLHHIRYPVPLAHRFGVGLKCLSFTGYEPVNGLVHLPLQAFPKFHDAADPHSFVVEGNGVKIGVFTDIGAPCDHVIQHFQQCHAAFLEANYDDGMLDQSYYPYYLKRRIRGGHGHLSNRQALELFVAHKPAFMSHVFLSHLSKDNNCPKLAKSLFETCADGTEVVVASRFQETAVYNISCQGDIFGRTLSISDITPAGEQLSLF
jgi:hypothetical protein